VIKNYWFIKIKNMCNKSFYKIAQECFGIKKKILDLIEPCEKELEFVFKKFDCVCEYNQAKILNAMQKYKLSDSHFNFSVGYGYDDLGRDITERIYAHVFNAESALVRTQIISGTHAIYIALAGNLNFGDNLIFICGKPYETLENIIKRLIYKHGVIYKNINLNFKNEFDYEKIAREINLKTKIILIQRSRGYELRDAICINKIKNAIKFIKNIREDIICLVDNCYGEFVEELEPCDKNKVKADLIAGSLIKNPGGGLAHTGGYLIGKEKLINNAFEFMTSLNREIGPSLGETHKILNGMFLAPQTVCCALKTAAFAASMFSRLGFKVSPSAQDFRTDIIQAISLGTRELLNKFCTSVQQAGPVNNFCVPIANFMPGYDCEIIMASGSFIQGASIEFSADAPVREPYTVFLQGALTWPHGKLGVLMTANNLLNQ